MNSPLVQKRSVAAAEINQPKLANILQMDKRMPARHFWRLQHNCASTRSSYGTTAFDRMASAIGCFEPGTFLWGHAHAETSYQRQPHTKSIFEHSKSLGWSLRHRPA